MTRTTRRLVLIWALLLTLTLGAFFIGIEQGAETVSAATIAVIGLALFKVRLIGLHFMDLRVAPRGLRLLFEGYALALFVTLVAIVLCVKP